MIARSYIYEHTVQIRSGGMDNDFLGTKVETTTTTVLVPDDSIYWSNVAFGHVRDYYAGNNYDPAFKLLSTSEMPVHVILHETKRL